MVTRNEKIAKCVIEVHRAAADHAENVLDSERANVMRHGLRYVHDGNSVDG